ncbi:unnamed protein product [Citrullus colocynthis]|uniref:Uncharacterized protein n=1 Tax=Citrullus colocynthis TaxID=252529 RepID=A0ABP0YVD5_9ROSI
MAEVQSFIFLSIPLFLSLNLIRSILTGTAAKSTTLRLPPTPPSLPLIGHLHLLSPKLYNSFRRLSGRMVMSTACSGEKNEAERIRYLVKEAMEVLAKLCSGDVLWPFKNLGFLLYGKRAFDVGKSSDELI